MAARIVYAVPYAPPGAPPNAWPGMRHTWTGWDGSLWDLNGMNGSGVWLRAGVRGLGTGPRDRFADTSPAVAGSRWRGSRAREREVFWPLTVYSHAGSQAWIDYDSAFWRTLDEDRPGVWTVTQPNGDARALTCRFVSDGDLPIGMNPALVGWAQYGVYLVAEQPYWAGELITRSFRPSDPLPFLPGGFGPPVAISEGSLTASAAIANPGDVPSWLEWWVQDAESAVVGVGDRLITVPFVVAPDRLLVIDTSPSAKSAIEIDAPPLGTDGNPQPIDAQQAWVAEHLAAGVDRTRELGSDTKWGALPRGTSSDLSVSVVGTSGTVRASHVPLYRRAW